MLEENYPKFYLFLTVWHVSQFAALNSIHISLKETVYMGAYFVSSNVEKVKGRCFYVRILVYMQVILHDSLEYSYTECCSYMQVILHDSLEYSYTECC